MKTEDLLSELAPTAAKLVDRHIETARDWYPHEFIPWGRGTDYVPDEKFDEAKSPLTPVAQSALVVNTLTEDNLPYYTFTLLSTLGKEDVWADWSRRWTAEEDRHAMSLRDYLSVIKGVDLRMLEDQRMQTMTRGWDPGWTKALQAFVYPTLQELATRISHRNTAKHIEDEVGRELIARIVTDENYHFLFYRDVTLAAMELDPSGVMIVLNDIIKNFAMPGVGIPGFDHHARIMADAGIYDFAVHHDSILVPVVLRQLNVEEVTGLDDEGEKARDEILSQIARMGKIADRMKARRGDPVVVGE